MTVSNSSAVTNPYQAIATNGFRQKMKDFKNLSDALQSGDITSAQSAFKTLQTDLQAKQANGKTSPLLDETTAAGKDFKALQDALKSGDVKAAQDAFATLKSDVRKTHGSQHHHKVDNDGDADDGGAAVSNTDKATDAASTAAAANPTLDVMA